MHPKFMEKMATSDEAEYKWAVMKEVMMNTTKQIEKKFPGIPILPVFGPTDNLGKYEAPESTALKQQLFDDIQKIWFEHLQSKRNIVPTFMEGGYYYYELNESFQIIGLNSLYWSK
jgi:hypothetical protein